MRVRWILGAVIAFLFLLADGMDVRGDEIRLKNGNVLEGKIISETPEEVVIECDFGKITVRRSQIESIKRWRRPSRYEKKPEASGVSLRPPPGAVPVPKTDAYFLPPGAPWSRSAEGREGEVIYRFGTVGVLAVRAFDTPGGARGSFMDFVHSYMNQFLSRSRVLSKDAFLHGGRDAYELAHEDPMTKGALTREYLVDLGEKKILVRLVGDQKRIRECVGGYVRVRNTLCIPEVRSGKRHLGRSFEIRTPFVTIAYDPPTGPWEFQKEKKKNILESSYFRDKEGLILVVVGFWDGHGKLAIHVLNAVRDKLTALDLNMQVVSNERTHDMGRRVEFTADVRVEFLGAGYQGRMFMVHQDLCFISITGLAHAGKVDRIEGVMKAMKDSIRIEKDWTEALKDVHWQEKVVKDAGIRFKVPRWWEAEGGRMWRSPGGSAVHIDAGPLGGPPPTLQEVQKVLSSLRLNEFRDLRVLGGEKTDLRDAKGFKLDIAGSYLLADKKFEMRGELYMYFQDGRYLQLLTMAVEPGLERQKVVYDKIRKSIRF